MNQTEQMRELIEAALNMVDVKGRHHSEIAMNRLIEAAKKYREQALSDVNETPKNEHDSADALKPAKLVRLSANDIDVLVNESMNKLAILRIAKSHEPELVRTGLHDLTNAIMDALEAKNGGSHATD